MITMQIYNILSICLMKPIEMKTMKKLNKKQQSSHDKAKYC